MADVSKIQGPSGPPDNLGKKDKASADADKFKHEMRRRVTEVSNVDPDEQKKRKRQEEAEDEQNIDGPVQSQPTPPNQVTPFSLEQEKGKISPLDMQKKGPGISPLESAQPTAPPKKTDMYQAPSPSEMEDDSGVLEEDSFFEKSPAPGAAAPQAPESQPEQTPTAPPASEPPPSTQPPQQGETVSTAPTNVPSQQKQQQKAASVQPGPPQSQEKSGLSAASLEGVQPKKVEETAAFFEQMNKEGQKEGKKGKLDTEELAEEAEAGAAGAVSPPPFGLQPEEKAGKKVEEKEVAEEGIPQGMQVPDTGGQIASPPPLESLPPYASLSPQVMELFDRMAGVMTVMNASGITETTITLNAPQFASSVFFGAQIIIQEFSTAPKAFNIQLNGAPQAVALFQGNANDLMAAFQAGNYNFRVNRLETGYLTERPLFKRKGKTGENDKEKTGENPT